MAVEKCLAVSRWIHGGDVRLARGARRQGVSAGTNGFASGDDWIGVLEWGTGRHRGDRRFPDADLHYRCGDIMVIRVRHSCFANCRASLSTELMIALGILVGVMFPVAYSMIHEQKLARA